MGEEQTMEMYDDEVEAELDWGGTPDFAADRDGPGPLPGRLELIRILKAEREIERLKGILAAITEAYRHRIERHEAAISVHRASLVAMLEHGEKINFPDLGTAYLTTVRPRIEVTDKTVAEKVAEELGCLTQVADMKALKAKVMAQVTDGTGEIPPGMQFVPERKSVTIKR